MEKITQVWILSVESLLIVTTNLLVATALLMLIRKKGGQSWCFVLNLALADTLVGVAITGVATTVIPPTSRTKCLVCMELLTSPSAASILTMFLISLDRYIAIKLPLRYLRISGPKTTAVALLALWLLSFFIGFLPGMIPEMQKDMYTNHCTFFSIMNPQSIILVFCICFFPVLSIFIYFYVDILKIACSHQRQISSTRALSPGPNVPTPTWYRRHIKALRTVAVLVGCFTLSWCPFFIVSIHFVIYNIETLQAIIENYLWLLGLSNSLINPLVYAFWQKEVRQELCSLLARVKGKLLQLSVSEAQRTEQTGQTETAGPGRSQLPRGNQNQGEQQNSTVL